LCFAEREEIALLRAEGKGVRAIAREIGRSPSTISRELRRNAATRGGKLAYRASVAQWKAELVACRPKTAKLAANAKLREYVQDRLAGRVRRPDGTPVAGPAVKAWKGRGKPRRADRRWATAWSPEQISARLKVDFPDDPGMRISHEAIYQSLFVQGRGALARELTACLRTGRALRVPRARVGARGKGFITEEVMISQRPAEAADRAVPGQLGGRPDHRHRPVGDRHAGRAHHQVHHAAAPAPDGRLRRRTESQERPRPGRLRRRSHARGDRSENHHAA
jgi:hypothetical protein